MSGVYSGVKTRILEKQKTAKYIHCAVHNLNLVVNDAMSGIPENVNFFGTLEQLYVFFQSKQQKIGVAFFMFSILKETLFH